MAAALTLTDGSVYTFELDDTGHQLIDESIRRRRLTPAHLKHIDSIQKFLKEHRNFFDSYDYRVLLCIVINGTSIGYIEQLSIRNMRVQFFQLLDAICYDHLMLIMDYVKDVYPELKIPELKDVSKF